MAQLPFYQNMHKCVFKTRSEKSSYKNISNNM